MSGQIQFVRVIFYEKERGVQVSKQKLEIREAMTLLLLYYVSPPTKLRVAFINTICSERLLNLGPYRQPKFGGYKRKMYFCPAYRIVRQTNNLNTKRYGKFQS